MDYKPMFSEVVSDYLCEDFTENEGDIKAMISIDGAKTPDSEEMEVIAQVVLSTHGDILVVWVNNGARTQPNVLEEINFAKEQLKDLRSELCDN